MKFSDRPRIKGSGAVIQLRGAQENQFGTVTRNGDTLTLVSCISKGGITRNRRKQVVKYPTVRIAKEWLCYMAGQTCEASLPDSN